MAGKVRAEAPADYLRLVATLGGSPERVLAAAGVTTADLADPERPIDIETVMRIADAAAGEVGDECLGLHAGRLVDLGVLGMLTYAVLNAPTVGTALRNFERYARSHFRGPRIALTIDGDEARLALLVDVPDGVPRRQHAETAAVVGLAIMRRLTGNSDWHPRRVLFAHDPPRDVSEHDRILGAPSQFRQPVHMALVFDAADLGRPVPEADRRLLPIIERHLDELLARSDPDSTWVDEVRTAIASSICDGRPKIGTIARRFGLSTRTFQRRLDEHRVVFKDLVEGVRRDLSLRYVGDGRTPLTDVAFLVGYSELSAFGRAFRRWTGSSPLTMRRNLVSIPAGRP
jgi:AraC-like DNA-binding protein